MKKSAVIAAAVLIFALAALAYGQIGGYGMGGRGMGPGMMGECMMGGQMMEAEHHMSQCLMGLDLDEQQKTLTGEIRNRMMKETIQRNADMRIVHIDLRDLLSKDPVDMKAVEAKVKQLEMMRTEMHLSHIKAMEDIKTKLTPEQRKKFREMIEAGPMMEEMEMMRDRKGGIKGE
jgi:Spy/CpxP family protein refolding chaperone